jgi:hypothetical protein
MKYKIPKSAFSTGSWPYLSPPKKHGPTQRKALNSKRSQARNYVTKKYHKCVNSHTKQYQKIAIFCGRSKAASITLKKLSLFLIFSPALAADEIIPINQNNEKRCAAALSRGVEKNTHKT